MVQPQNCLKKLNYFSAGETPKIWDNDLQTGYYSCFYGSMRALSDWRTQNFPNDLGKKMGGLGSGRRGTADRPIARLVAEDCYQISMTDWLRRGYCQTGTNWATDRNTKQAIAWTACNYGQARPWFICPRCLRRAGKLFKPWETDKSDRQRAIQKEDYREANGGYRCRKCLNLTYTSSNASGHIVAERRCSQARLRRKLRISRRDGLERLPLKPKGMHWRSYTRILRDYIADERQYYRQAFEQLEHQRGYVHQLKQQQPSFKHYLQALRGLIVLAKFL